MLEVKDRTRRRCPSSDQLVQARHEHTKEHQVGAALQPGEVCSQPHPSICIVFYLAACLAADYCFEFSSGLETIIGPFHRPFAACKFSFDSSVGRAEDCRRTMPLQWRRAGIFRSLVQIRLEGHFLSGGALANRLRRRTSDQTVLRSNPAVAAALSPWTRLFTPIVPRKAFTLASISYLAILVKYILAKKRKEKLCDNLIMKIKNVSLILRCDHL